MAFSSILFARPQDASAAANAAPPDCFVDLNLDRIVADITNSKQGYDLTAFFYLPLRAADAITYRQEVARDLEDDTTRAAINAFAHKLVLMRRYLKLIGELHYVYHKAGWFLEAAATYCEAVGELTDALGRAVLQSRGLLALRDYLAAYIAADDFTTLRADVQHVTAGLGAIQYCVLIRGDLVKVRRYEAEIDYSLVIEQLFERFRQGEVRDFTSKLAVGSGMNHIEAQILDFVAALYPEPFATLNAFCKQHATFQDETIGVFDREIQFYLAYLDYIAPIKRAGLPFCYPHMSRQSKAVFSTDGFDLALASKLTAENLPIVCNDFYLQEPERILVVSGANQGGKTTFARMVGQLHFLGCLGCPVPGRSAQLYLFDTLLTHFEREEAIANLRGKLQDDLLRIDALLRQATPHSILIMNEIFASTTLQDAVFLSQKIGARIAQLDLLCVWVTFIDELATLSAQTVSMVSTVRPEDPGIRTYRIVRQPADGLAYALNVARKHRLTYADIKERIGS